VVFRPEAGELRALSHTYLVRTHRLNSFLGLRWTLLVNNNAIVIVVLLAAAAAAAAMN
jgi:hypothetical protein